MFVIISLLTNAIYDQEERITRLVDATDISLLPSLNPDGWERATEGACSGTGRNSGASNENDVDLNTDFPTPEVGKIYENMLNAYKIELPIL